MKRNIRFSETEIAWEVERKLSERLPPGWEVQIRRSDRSPDWALTLRSPAGEHIVWAVETRTQMFPKDVAALRKTRRRSILVAAPYLGRSTREALATGGISYCDTTGNLRLLASSPGVWIEGSGATSNPWKEEASLASLRGRAAGQVARALCDFRPPFKIRDLAAKAGVSPATASRVADLLDRDAVLTRDGAGTVLDVRWPELLRRWSHDVRVLDSGRARSFLDPRGLAAFVNRLKAFEGRAAVTGSLAVPTQARVAPPRLAIVYVENVPAAAEALGLTAVDTGANVLLVEADSGNVFDGMAKRDGLPCATLTQVAADLFNSPGRGPSEAEALLDWMKQNEAAWRVSETL